jgi:hypothetical protein
LRPFARISALRSSNAVGLGARQGLAGAAAGRASPQPPLQPGSGRVVPPPPLATIRPLPRLPESRAALAAVLAVALAALALAASPAAAGGLLVPPGKKVYFGISDTGDPAPSARPSPSTRR